MDNLSVKILKKFVALSVVVFLIIGGISYFWIKELYIQQIKKDLISDVDLLLLQLKNKADFTDVAKAVKKAANIRVTIIDKDGRVLADSDANTDVMENQKSKDEVFEATYKPYGMSIRSSKTVHKELLYVAKKATIKEREYFVRVGTSFEDVLENFLTFGVKIAVIFVLFLGGYIYITYKISSEVRYETDKIINFLKNLKEQTSASTISSKYSEEFVRITRLLTEVSAALAKKNKKKSKYTAKLKLANRQKDEILSALSHEFKNPISVITGYSQTLIEDKELNPTIRNKFLDKIYASAIKLSSMIDRLRMFIKLEEDTHPIKYKKISLVLLAREVVGELEKSYPMREILLEVKQEVFKEVDETLFSVALGNLIENGLKYSEDEVVVTVDEQSIAVIDKGIGIEKKEIEKITSKFYRVDTNGWDNSLGIGLSLVSHIVKLHKFRLEIQSQKLKGSVFRIVF